MVTQHPMRSPGPLTVVMIPMRDTFPDYSSNCLWEGSTMTCLRVDVHYIRSYRDRERRDGHRVLLGWQDFSGCDVSPVSRRTVDDIP